MFARFAGPAVLGHAPPLEDKIRRLGTALGQPETGDYIQARQAFLLDDSANEHALLDVAGIIAWHAMISKVVDVSGFYSAKVTTIIGKLTVLVIWARTVREFLLAPLRVLMKLKRTVVDADTNEKKIK